MDQWEFPSCSVCYDRLLSNLCLIPECGHIYHQECIQLWLEKITSRISGCPLCRKPIDINTIIEVKYDIIRKPEAPHEAVGTNAVHTPLNEDSGLNLRLERAIADNLELHKENIELETEKQRLIEELNKSIGENKQIVEQNKDLKLIQAANKATINRLNEIVSDQKVEIEKFKAVNNYLEDEEKRHLTPDNANGFLNSLNANEKIVFLNNRIIELEQINKTLYDLRDNWKRECNSINQDYLALEREYKRLLFSQKPGQENPSTTPTKTLNKIPFELNDRSALRERKRQPPDENPNIGINTPSKNGVGTNKGTTHSFNVKRKSNDPLEGREKQTKLMKNKTNNQAEYRTPTRVTIHNFFKSQND